MEIGLFIILWYGILHAFGPDHLTAIADFSIGKSVKKTLLITTAFAFGHGVMLFVFAKALTYTDIPQSLMGYGDILSSIVILGIGLYLLYMVIDNRIQLRRHVHEGSEHIHIWFGKEHSHNDNDTASALTIGALMGIGGVRGMLITLGVIDSNTIDLFVVGAFVLGVTIVFVTFGLFIVFINKQMLTSKQNVRRTIATVGAISVFVGANMLLG